MNPIKLVFTVSEKSIVGEIMRHDADVIVLRNPIVLIPRREEEDLKVEYLQYVFGSESGLEVSLSTDGILSITDPQDFILEDYERLYGPPQLPKASAKSPALQLKK